MHARPTNFSTPQKYERTTVDRLGVIYVQDRLNYRWIPVPAIDQEYASGLSLYKHKIIRRYVRYRMRQDVDIYALAIAKHRITQVVEHEWNTTKKTRSRLTAARLLDKGKAFGVPPTGAIDTPNAPLVDEQKASPTTPSFPQDVTTPSSSNASAHEEPFPDVSLLVRGDPLDDFDISGFGADLGLPSAGTQH